MRVALHSGVLGHDEEKFIQYARDLDVSDVVLSHRNELSAEQAERRVARMSAAGLRVAAWGLTWLSPAALEGGAEAQVLREKLVSEIRILGEVGVPVVYTFTMVAAAEEPAERERQWGNLVEFYKPLVAAAEEAQVNFCTHAGWTPNRILHNCETVLRLLDEVPSERHGVCLCVGCYHGAGDDVPQVVRRFGRKIFFAHARDARGVGPECPSIHLGQGTVPWLEVIRALREVGYEGVIQPEHLGKVSAQEHEEISQAMAVGYLKALISVVEGER